MAPGGEQRAAAKGEKGREKEERREGRVLVDGESRRVSGKKVKWKRDAVE